ncbi:hypothetical protein [Streptomyces griseocarneus]|uniref:hypothetical protein n=1 Tax=Streptomyces griseocarneus TaxID=51201 RepID=UPI00167CB1EC|nr:hypothetical protein [Streptomyces griseocarneus]MBZ6476644.1 hypothetical protein [Streptomyces griseocarneus]GHG80113.1 hypothetical protein GCM10018779_61370 [Streptomyces griseocarneus]
MTNRSAVRHNRRPLFVAVESATARDIRISYRALGLLTYCLDQHDSWNVRSEQLARGEGREGRDAVRKALHELAAHGYYRLERRRFLDGKTAMGAAVSAYPVEQWAKDYITFGHKLDVPVVEQEDGSFRVRYPDNSLGSDGFASDPDARPDDVPAEDAPEWEEPEPEPEPEKKPRRVPPAAARAAAKKAQQPSPSEKQGEMAGETKVKTPAQEVATWYYDHAIQHLGPYAGKQKSGWYFGLVKLSQQALDAEYTQKQVAKAFQRTGVHFPTAHQFQRALSDERNNKPMPAQYGGRPAPYSDAATWGTNGPCGPPALTAPDDGATFGIVPA